MNVSGLTKDSCPLISIVTSTLNAADSIASTIKSIRKCEYPSIEYIVIDGGSTDATAEMVRQANDVVSVFVSEPDTGIYNAWNKGIRRSRGKYLAFLGSGDVFVKGGLQALVACALANPQADYISSKAIVVSRGFKRTVGGSWNWAKFRRYMCVAHPGSLHSRRLFSSYGEFDESYRIAGDYELLLRPAETLRAVFVDRVTVQLSGDGISRTDFAVIDETKKAKIKNHAVSFCVAKFDSMIAYFKLSLRSRFALSADVKKKVLISTFNLYVGGSLALYQAIQSQLASRSDLTELSSVRMPCNQSGLAQQLKINYPIRYLNGFYRVIVEQLFVPLIAIMTRAGRIVMMGNFPCAMWFARQTVLFHNVHYLSENTKARNPKQFLEWALFKLLIGWKRPRVVVQTDAVANRFRSVFPLVREVEVIGTPFPFSDKEMTDSAVHQTEHDSSLRLFYPALFYPHKNHRILFECENLLKTENVVITLTIDPTSLPDHVKSSSEVFDCVGVLSRRELLNKYRSSDALLFASSDESLGLPLIEAVALSLPIIAPDLPYVRAVIDNFYDYDLFSAPTLAAAIRRLKQDIGDRRPKVPTSRTISSAQAFVSALLA